MSDKPQATSELEAFGYGRRDDVWQPTTMYVAEGKTSETLQPQVILFAVR